MSVFDRAGNGPRPTRIRPHAGGWGLAVVIALLATLLYAGTLEFDFTLDDVHVVRQNPTVQNLWWRDAITGPYWPETPVRASNWRPVATLSWCLDRWAAGANEASALRWHHGGNAVLYGLTVLALFVVARRWCCSATAAAIACAMFAVHPAHTEVVAPVVGRTDLIAALGGWTMCAAFWQFRDTGRWYGLALSTLAFAVGLGGKESAAPLLLLLPLADILWFGRSWRELFGRAGLAYLPLVAVAMIYGATRVWVLGDHTVVHAQAASIALFDRLALTGRNTWVSLGLLVLPLRFHHLLTTLPVEAYITYPLPIGILRYVWLMAALPLWLGWIPLAKRAPTAALIWVAVLLPWSPTSGLLPVGGGVSLRFLFISTGFAACGAVVAARWALSRRPSYRAAIVVAALTWSTMWLAVTWQRIPKWRNNAAFYAAVLSEEPRSRTANLGLGTTFALSGDLVEARRWFRRAIELAGDSEAAAEPIENLAITYEYGPIFGRFGRDAPLERALALYHEALSVKPDALKSRLAAATVSATLATREDATAPEREVYQRHAIDQILLAVDMHPDHPGRFQWHRDAASLAMELGEDAIARRELEAAATDRAARKTWVLAHEGRLAWSREQQRAIFDLEEALSLAPPVEDRARLERMIQELRDQR